MTDCKTKCKVILNHLKLLLTLVFVIMDRLENSSSLVILVIMIVSQQGVVVVRVGNNVELRVWDDDGWSKVKLDKV